MSSDLEIRARRYVESHGVEVDWTQPLGFGQDGRVWHTRLTAIKVFERERNYYVELECYQRLLAADVVQLERLNVPRLVNFDDSLQIIEMEIVKPPYLLDFGKAHLDHPPDFSPETMSEWGEQLVDFFGDDVPRVKSVLRRLTQFGIYYYDAKPANIRLHLDR